MELSYWESRWNKNNIGFHMQGGYPALRKHWSTLRLPKNPHVIVPLCGKSEDMIFLEQQGARVTGIEISEKAIREFFREHNREAKISKYSSFTIFRSGSIELWQGDFLKFPNRQTLNEPVHLVYDKAALVALPKSNRSSYADKVCSLLQPATSILLHHFIYPQQEMNGPPFSVTPEEIKGIFTDKFTIRVLEESIIPPEHFPPFQRRGLKSPITERLIHLSES